MGNFMECLNPCKVQMDEERMMDKDFFNPQEHFRVRVDMVHMKK